MLLQSILKFRQTLLLAAVSMIYTGALAAGLPMQASDGDNDGKYEYRSPIPQLVKPVGLRLDKIDHAIRKSAYSVIRNARVKTEAAQSDQNDALSQTVTTHRMPGDSIRIAGGLAIHPADTLNLITDRYYATYTPAYYSPLIFDTYTYLQPESIAAPDIIEQYFVDFEDPYTEFVASMDPDDSKTRLADIGFSRNLLARARQNYMVRNPQNIKYNLAYMPEPPRHFRAVVEPGTTNITLEEIDLTPANTEVIPGVGFKPQHWLATFQSSLQFSQAYISPNWYQGGSNNINAILQLYYNIKLNEKFHPNLLFDTTFQYKLGVNSAPDDSIHNYNITEDLFQVYTKFGLKASHNWYYTINAVFKTQLTNSYPTNSHNLRSAFMSPGELNIGIGMTYSKSTKLTQFNASIAPLSYNMKTCLSDKLNPASFGIDEGRKTAHQYGSSTELTFKWKWAYNINYSSRLFLFTNYEYAQGDWENTISFDINQFLSTQVYWHLRYDTTTGRLPDSDWHRFQFKEIFSLGFSYKFKNS